MMTPDSYTDQVCTTVLGRSKAALEALLNRSGAFDAVELNCTTPHKPTGNRQNFDAYFYTHKKHGNPDTVLCQFYIETHPETQTSHMYIDIIEAYTPGCKQGRNAMVGMMAVAASLQKAKASLTHIDLLASLDVGPHAWARMGFLPWHDNSVHFLKFSRLLTVRAEMALKYRGGTKDRSLIASFAERAADIHQRCSVPDFLAMARDEARLSDGMGALRFLLTATNDEQREWVRLYDKKYGFEPTWGYKARFNMNNTAQRQHFLAYTESAEAPHRAERLTRLLAQTNSVQPPRPRV